MAAIDLISKALWFRGDTLPASGSVTSWTDSSGNGTNASLSACTIATGVTPNGTRAINGSAMAASVSTLNMLQGTYVRVTASWQSSFVPANLTDGDASTLWSVVWTGATQTITYRIRSAADATTYTTATITEYTIRNGGTSSNSPTAWTFQGSNNPAGGWTTLHTVTGATTTANTSTAHTFSNSTAYEYYRWNITAINGGGSCEWLMANLTGVSTGKTQRDGELWVFLKRDTANSTAWRLGTSGQSSHYDFGGSIYDDTGSTVRRSFTPSVAITSWRTYRVRVEGTNWTAYLDGSAQSGSSSSSTKAWQTSAPSPFVGFSGWIAEWMLVDHATDSTEQATINAWFAANYVDALPVNVTDLTAAATADGLVETVTLAGPTLTDIAAAATADGLVETVTVGPVPPMLTDVTADAAAAGLVETVTLADPTLTDVTAEATAAGLVETITVGGLAMTDVTAAATADGLVETVDLSGESLGTEFDYIDVDDLTFAEPTTVDPLTTSEPVMRQSYLMPVLTEANPAWTPRKDIDAVDAVAGFYPVIEEAVGRPNLWIDGQNVTYFRDQETVITRFDSELPWGDKGAMFAFPQLNPWEKPGEGDWSFLHRDAEVLIGIVDVEGGGIRRLWGPGFLDARGSGLGEGEDYTHEAKGPMWALMHQIHEPRTYQPPEDIGSLIPDLVNNARGNHLLNTMPKTVTGRMTRKRGARDQPLWRLIQDILAIDGWTTDGTDQWTIIVGDDATPRLTLKKALATVDATYAFGNPNIDTDLRFDYSTACDVVWARGIAPGGGAWANMFFPGLELLQGLPYPNSDAGVTINLGDSDGDTDSGTGVTDWQRKAKDLGYAGSLSVTGVMSSAWVSVVRTLQSALGLTVDGSIGPQTWTSTFDDVDESIDLTPLRLPMARKPWAWKTLHSAKGVETGPNPDYIDNLIPREAAIDLGPNVPKYPEGLNYAQTYLAIHGEPRPFGTITFVGSPDNVDVTRLRVGDNVETRGFEGEDVVTQIGSMTTELDVPGGFRVTARVDEGRRDALTIEQLLSRDRDALPDPARRPGNPNRSSRQVTDDGFVWDAESPCGVLTRMAINGEHRLWSAKTIPFAEIGQLAGIVLQGTFPWAMVLFASLRITPNILRGLMPAGPFTSDPWRPIMETLEDDYACLAAWGEAGDRCGYSRGTERDGYSFSGLFREASTLEYVTETVPYVKLLATMDGTSGFLEGEFEPAYSMNR